MSLDKQIKEMASVKVDDVVEAAYKAVEKVVKGTGLKTNDVARLVSGHKTKSTFDASVKVVAEKISADMMASLGNKEPGKDDS